MVSVDESDLIATPAAVDESFTVISGFKVTGTVYDGENPKGGINILFYSTETEESYTTMSAPDGKYVIYVPAGTYQVSVAGGYNVTSPSTSETINSDRSNFSILITAGAEYENTATVLSIASTEQLEGFEAIDDYFYTVTTDIGIITVRRYAYNSSDTVNEYSIYPEISTLPTKVSTAVLGSELNVLTSYYDEQVSIMETYLYKFDKALNLKVEKISFNSLNEQIQEGYGSVIDTSLITDKLNNLYYAVVTPDGQMLWYKIGDTNTSEPFMNFSDYGYTNTMFTVPEVCCDGQYVYYVLTSTSTEIYFELCRFNLYTGTVESMGSGSITDTNYFPIFQLSCDDNKVSIYVALDEGYLIGEAAKNMTDQTISLYSYVSPYTENAYTEQGFEQILRFNVFSSYYENNTGMPLDYPERTYFTHFTPTFRYFMNPFRKTQDRIYVIGQTKTGFGVISYPEAYTEFETPY